MKYECVHNVQMHGKFYKRGVVMELSKEDATTYAHSWKKINEQASAEPNTEEMKSKRDIQTRLDQLGIAYRARDSYEELLERLNNSGTASVTRK